MILQRAGYDLGGGSRAAVDENNQRLALGEVPRARVESLGLLRTAAASRYDLACLEERIRHRDRLIEQPAGIVAQIDDKALELVAGLSGEIDDGFLQVVSRLLVKLTDANEADIVTFQPGTHRAHADDIARDRYLDRLILAFTHDLELDLGIHPSPYLLDGLIECEALYRLLVEVR